MRSSVYFLLLLFPVIESCSSSVDSINEQDDEEFRVIIHESADADMLNPVLYSDGHAGAIMGNMFHPLLGIDRSTLEIIPVLATSRPEIRSLDTGLIVTYSIRPEAVWDNGEPVTARDVEFTLKVNKTPGINNMGRRATLDHMKDFIYYDDIRKFSIYLDQKYVLAEAATGGFFVLPEYNYDRQGRLRNYTFRQMSAPDFEAGNDTLLKAFAAEFSSERYQRDRDFITGSGPYYLDEWNTNQRIILKKKNNWWGHKVKDSESFRANPSELVYQIINDPTAALVALKSGALDVNYSLRTKDFIDLRNSEKFREKFEIYTPDEMIFHYIGLNMRNPVLSDIRVRQALAHLVNVPRIIEVVQYGLASPINGPVHPAKKNEYNDTITPYSFSPETAKKLLAEAGWADTDGDGILDKMIGGKRTPLKLNYLYNAGNDERKSIGLLFQEEARKAGVSIEVRDQEWGTFLETLSKYNFDMFSLAASSTPVATDYKQQFHTSQIGAANLTFFGNEETDALIDSIRVELDENKRKEMHFRMQSVIFREVPMIFLFARRNKIVISKRFENTGISVMRPGYYPAGFELVKTHLP